MDTITPRRGDRAALRLRSQLVLVLVGTALALVALAMSLVWLIAPSTSPFAAEPTPLQAISGSGEHGVWLPAIALAVAATVMAVVGLLVIVGRTPPARVAVATLASSAVVMVGTVGFAAIALAGYSMAFLVPLGLAALLIGLAVRRPTIGIPIAAVVVALAVLVQLGPIPVLDFLGLYLGSVADQLLTTAVMVGLVALSGVWALWSVLRLARERGPIARSVLRHRVPITIAAAACSLPYAIARASWLTPWPLLGGSQEAFDADPVMRVIGLMLGTAMLVGGVLTIGLVLPWGSRVPAWLPGGGRHVPVALAIVPASIVAALFTAAGIDLATLLVRPSDGVTAGWEAMLFFPFWLWGPLLGLATWGYAMHREARA